jgi:hypothetical protein
VRYPYRIVTRSRKGDRRVFWATHIHFEEGWVEATGGFAGDGRAPMRVSLPLWTVEYIEETGWQVVKRGWVRPRVDEEPRGPSTGAGQGEAQEP